MGEQSEQIKAPKSVNGLTVTGNKTKLIIAASIGNFLEIFDFTVYSFFSLIIGQVFFKTEDPFLSFIYSVSIFGVGFIMRPFGSIIIGAYADSHGRKSAMLLTIILMAIGSMLIGFAPTYAMVGFVAPFFILVGRLLQGFSAGGEIGAATTLLMESSGKNQRGFFVSWQFIGQGFSTLCGSLLAAYLTKNLSTEAMLSWGWRVPFILSLLIIPVGLYIRSHIHETFDISQAKKHDIHPFKVVITEHTRQFILGVLIILPVTILMYILIFYMPNYLKITTKISDEKAFLVSSYASIVMTIFSLIAGFYYDRLQKRKLSSFMILLVAFITSYLEFYFAADYPLFLLFHFISVACLGLIMPFSVLLIMEAFEQKIRATATAVVYAFGVTIFGGTAQIIVTRLLQISNKNIMAPYWYLGLALVIGMVAIILFKEKRYEH